MKTQQRWTVLVCSVVVSAAVLGGVFDSSTAHRQKGKEMNTTRISVNHVSNCGYTKETAEKAIAEGHADLISSMPSRWKLGMIRASAKRKV